MFLNKRTPTAFLRLWAAMLLVTVSQSGVVPAQKGLAQSFGVASQDRLQHPNSEILIGAGDLLEVTVYGTDFNKQVRVSDSGEISLPLVGTVKVGGLSIHEAEQRLAKELSQGGYFNDPQVSIFEREYTTQAISVLGEVQKPGLYPLPGVRTLFDAISAAGGTTPRAGNKVTVTRRGGSEQPEIVPLSYNADEPNGDNPRVYPGDTIVVSKAGIVYVVGDVRQPKGIVMENSQMTVLQAISMAQGTNPTAALNHAKLIRKTPDGPKDIPIQLKSILASKAPDLPLQADDILFVPTSVAKSAGKRTLEAIVQTATGLAIYRPF
jgi:polysaccharide export outer membrane protein